MYKYSASMENYFNELLFLRRDCENMTDNVPSGVLEGMKPEIARAIYGDMDALFACFRKEIITSYEKIERKKLEKVYKKLDKKIEKLKDKYTLKYADKCFSDEDRQIPCVLYELALLRLYCGMPDCYINSMETAAVCGDPRAITYCLDYYSTDSEDANPFSNISSINLNGKFDFCKMLYYAVLGMGFAFTPYYPDKAMAIPGWQYGEINVVERRSDTLKRLYNTLSFFAVPENIGTAEYKRHFGDFAPDELQIKIARHWFFMEDDRIEVPDDTRSFRDEIREKIIASVCGSSDLPKKITKSNKRTISFDDIPDYKELSKLTHKSKKTPLRIDDSSSDTDYSSILNTTEAKSSSEKTERIKYKDGGVYEGETKDGLRHGKGTYYYTDGSEFEGNWINSKKCGYGVYKCYEKHKKSGELYLSYIYEGEWDNGRRNGYGVAKGYKPHNLSEDTFMSWSYEGPWKDDNKHGSGTYREFDGNELYDHWKVYEGEWIDNERQGLFVWRPEPAAADLKYIDYYEDGKAVVRYIDYDPSIVTLEDAKRAKEAESEESRRRSEEHRATEEAIENIRDAIYSSINTKISRAKANGTIFPYWENVDPDMFDEDRAFEADGMLLDTESRVTRSYVGNGYYYMSIPKNGFVDIAHLYISDGFIRASCQYETDNEETNKLAMRKEYLYSEDEATFYKLESIVDEDANLISGGRFFYITKESYYVRALQDCVTLPDSYWSFQSVIRSDELEE